MHRRQLYRNQTWSCLSCAARADVAIPLENAVACVTSCISASARNLVTWNDLGLPLHFLLNAAANNDRRLCKAQLSGLKTSGLRNAHHIFTTCIAVWSAFDVYTGVVSALQAAAPQTLSGPAGMDRCSSISAWHKGLTSRSLPVTKHEGKGGHDQRHNQDPHSGCFVEVPEGNDQGNVQQLHAETLTCHTPLACFDGIQGQL